MTFNETHPSGQPASGTGSSQMCFCFLRRRISGSEANDGDQKPSLKDKFQRAKLETRLRKI